jgi:hypothetical protein
MNRRPARFVTVLLAAMTPAFAQDLRRGIVDADLVAVARQTGVENANPDLELHRLQIVAGVRGVPAGVTAVTVLDWPKNSQHNRPSPQTRLYCLQDGTAAARRAGLPEAGGPYFRMVGWAGSNPAVGADVEADPAVQFARLLAAAENGADANKTAQSLADLAVRGAPGLRTEAARLLAERPDLRSRLTAVHWSSLLTAVSGEVDDVGHKIALAELCGEQRLPGLADALVVGAVGVHQPDWLRAAGRLLANLRGEDATPRLVARLQLARAPADRAALLFVLGATRTDSALDALLEMRHAVGADQALDAALAEHKSRRAREALQQGKDGK